MQIAPIDLPLSMQHDADVRVLTMLDTRYHIKLPRDIFVANTVIAGWVAGN